MNFLEQYGHARILADQGSRQLAAALAKAIRTQMRNTGGWFRKVVAMVLSETSFRLQANPTRPVREDEDTDI